MTEFYADPAGAFVDYKGVRYYKDGILHGYILNTEEEPYEMPMPTLWSTIVITYRKKPVEVQAIQLDKGNLDEVALWCGGEQVRFVDPLTDEVIDCQLKIPTLEGVMVAKEGDYIIRGVKGEFYPCKPDIFVQTYEIA